MSLRCAASNVWASLAKGGGAELLAKTAAGKQKGVVQAKEESEIPALPPDSVPKVGQAAAPAAGSGKDSASPTQGAADGAGISALLGGYGGSSGSSDSDTESD